MALRKGLSVRSGAQLGRCEQGKEQSRSLPFSVYCAPGACGKTRVVLQNLQPQPEPAEWGWRTAEHAVVIAGGGPTGLMLAGELALADVDVAIVERRASQDLTGSRAGGLHSRTIEVLDQRGIADRFLSQGQVAQVAGFAWIRLDISDFPTRHNYGLGLRQKHIEQILAGWVDEMNVPMYRGREVTGFVQDDTGIDVELSDGQPLRAAYLVGCDGGRSLIRKAAGIEFAGWDPTISCLIAEVEMDQEPQWGLRRDAIGVHAMSKLDDGPARGVLVTEQHLGHTGEPTLRDLSEALIAVHGTDFTGSTVPPRSPGSPT